MPCRTREEREAAYQEARARIFGEEAPAKAPSPSPSSASLDRAGAQEAAPAAFQQNAGGHSVGLAVGCCINPPERCQGRGARCLAAQGLCERAMLADVGLCHSQDNVSSCCLPADAGSHLGFLELHPRPGEAHILPVSTSRDSTQLGTLRLRPMSICCASRGGGISPNSAVPAKLDVMPCTLPFGAQGALPTHCR